MKKDRTFNISFFSNPILKTNHMSAEEYSVWSNKVEPLAFNWNELLNLLSRHEQVARKEDVWLLSPTEFLSPDHPQAETNLSFNSKHTTKKAINAAAISFLVLDIEHDESAGSIESFIAINKNFEYLLVSSFNHKIKKYGYKDRYRVFIPILKSLSTNEYKALKPALINKFPYADKTSFDVARAFFLPSCSPAAIDNAVVYHNKSDAWFDPFSLEQEQKLVIDNMSLDTDKTKELSGDSKLDFHLNTFNIVNFFQDKGLYIRSMGAGKHTVICPNHNNHTTPSQQNDSTVIYGSPGFKCLHSHCNSEKSGLKWLLEFYGADEISKYCKQKTIKLTPDIPVSRIFVKPSYERITKKLADAVDNILYQHENSNTGKSHCLYAAEGTSKSRSALRFYEASKTVIFLTKSYKQAYDKLNEFSALGVNPVLVKSTDAQFSELPNHRIIRKKSHHPFRSGGIHHKKTINKVHEHTGRPKKLLELHLLHSLDEDSIQKRLRKKDKFIIATFAQMRKLCATGYELNKNAVVFFDDPDFSDVIHISPFDNKIHNIPTKYQNENTTNIDVGMKTINGKKFFIREKGMAPNQQNCLMIYTTTELCIKNYLNTINVSIIDLMESIDAGNITILGTKKTYRKHDALLPIYIERLKKEGYNTNFIANGIGAILNHTNSKGLNNLKNKSIITKISQPPEITIETYIAALDIPNVNKSSTEWREIALIFMFDMLNQSIGRAAGYRHTHGNNTEIVALVDPAYHSYLIKYSRYALNSKHNALIDWRADSTKSRLPNGASKFLKKIDYYINSKEYICSKEYDADRNAVLDTMTDSIQKKYLERLLLAEIDIFSNSSGIAKFIDDQCIANGTMKFSEFKKSFKLWQKKNSRKEMKHSELLNELKQMGYEINNRNRNSTYFISGLSPIKSSVAA